MNIDNISSILVAILHHAPVLRYEHVANALCRSLSAQTPILLMRVVSNCPWSSSCVVKGCMDAYFQAEMLLHEGKSSKTNIESQAKEVMTICKSSIESIANLSSREAMHVINQLEVKKI